MSVRTVETPKYAKKIMQSEKSMARGIDFWGFRTSSPVVAMQSNPTKPKKQVAAPLSVPSNPKGKKPPEPALKAGEMSVVLSFQLSMSASVEKNWSRNVFGTYINDLTID